MEKIDLKKHKEMFKLLPKEEYSVLERAFDEGIELSSSSACGAGKKSLPDGLVSQLPYLFYDFKELATLSGKIEKLTKELGEGRNFRDSATHGPPTNKLRFAWCETIAYPGSAAVLSLLPQLAEQNPLLVISILLPLWPLSLWSAISSANYTHNISPNNISRNENSETFPPTPLICTKAFLDSSTYKLRKKSLLALAKKKQKRLKKRALQDITLASRGKLNYSKKWFRKEKKGLEEMLASANPAFAERLTELQKIIRPRDQLEFYRHFEGFAKQIEIGKWSKENVEEHLRKYKIIKGSGIWTEEAKKAFAKEAKKREKSFKAAFGPTENLPKDDGLARLADQMAEIALLENYFRKYPSISRSEERKKALREFYKEREDLLWTAKNGELDKLCGYQHSLTRGLKLSMGLMLSGCISALSLLALPLSGFDIPSWGGWVFTAPMYLSPLGDLRSRRASNVLKEYLRARGVE